MAKKGERISAETRQKMRQAALGKKASLESRERMRLAHLGRRNTPESREKNRQASLGHSVSVETREKLRQAMLGKHHSPETREKIRKSNLGNKHALGHNPSPEARQKMRESRLRQRFPKNLTAIERLLRDEFRKRRLKFTMHKTMFGRFQPDFIFEEARLIVQADGDYWHGPASVNRKRDAGFNKAAHDEGWSVWRFGGKEIEMHAAACARAVARFVRDHKT